MRFEKISLKVEDRCKALLLVNPLPILLLNEDQAFASKDSLRSLHAFMETAPLPLSGLPAQILCVALDGSYAAKAAASPSFRQRGRSHS